MAAPLAPVSTTEAPGAIGPYSQAIIAGAFCSPPAKSSIPTGIITEGGITAQTHQVLQNLGAVLKAAGISYDRVVKTTVYPLGYGQLSRGERNLRHLLPRAGAGARYDSGRRASTQRAGRNRPGGVSRLAVQVRVSLARSFHRHHTFDRFQRLHHPIEVLQIRNLYGHPDRPLMIGVSRGFYVSDIGVDAGDARADVGKDTVAVSDADAEAHRVGDVSAPLSHSTSMRRSGS